jgi:glycosyltransferase involved in cell wall biosynthesis
MATLVTVAIPTYRRPQLLRRALESVAAQRYEVLEVLVVDNATEGTEVGDVVEVFRARIPGLRFIRHDHNIGPQANFMFCLAEAKGAYFMWLADDDELSCGSLDALAAVLDEDGSVVTAVPHWYLKRSADSGLVIEQSFYESESALRRVLSYVWRGNDAFYYAMHRRSVLQQCRFVRFRWPNRNSVADVAYPYLMTLVMTGRIVSVGDRRALWINHAYSEKSYARTEVFVIYAARYLLRRINLHCIYCVQVTRTLGIGACLLVVPTSVASLIRELAMLVLRKGWRVLQPTFRPGDA